MRSSVVVWTPALAVLAFGCAGGIDVLERDDSVGGAAGDTGDEEATGGVGGSDVVPPGAGGMGATVGGGGMGATVGGGGVGATAGASTPIGTAGSGGSGGTVAEPTPKPIGLPTLLMVGWGGVRVVSHDLGKTWVDRVSIINEAYGDKSYIMRNAIWAKGLFIAIGDKIFTSPDGSAWTERVNPSGWIAELAYGNGMLVGAGGCAGTIFSLDGITWAKGDNAPDRCENHLRSAAFGNGQFAVAGDKSIVYVSKDARNWQVYPGLTTGNVKFCNGQFRDGGQCPTYRGDGPFVRLGGFQIDYSVDGKTWTIAHKDTNRTSTLIYGYPN